MLRKQNHDILIASERAQCLTARRHFLTGLYFIHNSVILPTIHACNELDLGSWQLFLVGGHPWRGGSESFPSSRQRQDPSLHFSAVWVMLELAGKGRGSQGFWHCPQGEPFLTAGITEKALKSWQNQRLAFFAG